MTIVSAEQIVQSPALYLRCTSFNTSWRSKSKPTQCFLLVMLIISQVCLIWVCHRCSGWVSKLELSFSASETKSWQNRIPLRKYLTLVNYTLIIWFIKVRYYTIFLLMLNAAQIHLFAHKGYATNATSDTNWFVCYCALTNWSTIGVLRSTSFWEFVVGLRCGLSKS